MCLMCFVVDGVVSQPCTMRPTHIHGHVYTSTCISGACINLLLMLFALLIGLHFPVHAWSMMVKAVHVVTTVIVWILVWYYFVTFIICIHNNNYFRMEVVTTSTPFDPVLFPHQREGGICTERHAGPLFLKPFGKNTTRYW